MFIRLLLSETTDVVGSSGNSSRAHWLVTIEALLAADEATTQIVVRELVTGVLIGVVIGVAFLPLAWVA